MRWILTPGIVATSLFASTAFATDEAGRLTTWIEAQSRIAQTRLYANFNPRGSAPGTILASPSRDNPNYYYYWVRDGALVMNAVHGLAEASTSPNERARHVGVIEAFVRMTKQNQLAAVANLGEPRFNVDGSVNTEPWGRPQNDGPALRALLLMRYAKDLLRDGQRAVVERDLYSATWPATTTIKTDLEYVAHNWRSKCIDIWEEIWGYHFFTQASQLAALREGAKLALVMNDEGAAQFYSAQASLLEAEVTRHWSAERGYYLATLNSDAGPDHQKPSELDTSVLLAALAVDQEAGPLSLLDDRMLATATKLEQTFKSLYAINADETTGTAIGRYAEDYYFSGNPWFLTTAAFAEYHYRVASLLDSAPSFKVTALNAPFFQRAMDDKDRTSLRTGLDLAQAPALRAKVIAALIEKGDTFLDRVRRHTSAEGSLSEQFSRTNGFMLSAHDLTWSYASVLRAFHARSRVVTPTRERFELGPVAAE